MVVYLYVAVVARLTADIPLAVVMHQGLLGKLLINIYFI